MYTRLYSIRNSFKKILKKLEKQSSVDEDNSLSVLECYIQLFNNLVEEVFKIHFYDILEAEDPDMEIGNGIDFGYYYSVILEDKETLDKHIPEIQLFKIVVKMILYVLDETKITKNSIIFQEITTICNMIKNYKCYHKNDILLDSLNLSSLFIVHSNSDCVQVNEELEQFLDRYLLAHADLPQKLRLYLFSIEALVKMDILDWGNGYTTYKLDGVESNDEKEDSNDEKEEIKKEEMKEEKIEEKKEEKKEKDEFDNKQILKKMFVPSEEENIQIFHELNFLKGFIYITSTVAKQMKNEFDTEELYEEFQNDCNQFLSLQ